MPTKSRPTSWAVAGVYVRLGLPERGGIVRARPGSGHDVLARLRLHPWEKPLFTRAIVGRDTSLGWNSAEAGYIEGHLHDLCRASDGVEHDFRRDQDPTLQKHEEGSTGSTGEVAMRAMLHPSGREALRRCWV